MAISKTITGMITALITIGILFIPAITMYEAERQTVNRVLTFEGLYDEGDIIHLRNLNQTEAELQFINEVIIGSSPNNDSFIYADNNIVKEMYYGNWVTYIGNGTYQINYDKNEPPFTITALEWNLGLPLAINGTTLSKYDFIKITMTGQDFNHPLFFKYWHAFSPWFPAFERASTPLDNNWVITHTTLLVMGLVLKSDFNSYVLMNGYPEYDIYIEFHSVPYIPESKHFGDGNFTFKIQGFNLDEGHQVFWKEEQLLYLSLGISIAIMTVATAFSTNLIGIKVGNKISKGETRKKK